mmetsp:Transcript_15384/g.61908  ORF Transcript_15384/g.61908 Transcript_15384/m.61908 type:complete len:361 (-) Transcript_15384:305-1387(-)
MRSRRSRSTSSSTMMATTSCALAAPWAASGSRRHASSAAPRAASAGLAAQYLRCARSRSTAASELLARAAPWIAVPNVTSVGAMFESSMRSRSSSISPNRARAASELRAMLYETTLSAMPRSCISRRIAVVALAFARSGPVVPPWFASCPASGLSSAVVSGPGLEAASSGSLAPRAQCSSALYVARGISSRKPSRFMRRHNNMAVRPLGGRDLPHAAIAAWYSVAERRSTGSESMTENGVRWSPARASTLSANRSVLSSSVASGAGAVGGGVPRGLWRVAFTVLMVASGVVVEGLETPARRPSSVACWCAVAFLLLLAFCRNAVSLARARSLRCLRSADCRRYLTFFASSRREAATMPTR